VAPPIEDLDASESIRAIFQFIENFPDADHGTPGPLVHLLEKHTGRYESELKDSIGRRPTPHTLWMINRLLNSCHNDDEHGQWMAIPRSTLEHPLATEGGRDDAKSFIEHQQSH
jgi:hypothetical protein